METYFKAPWSTSLKVLTLLSSAVLLVVAGILLVLDPPPGGRVPAATAMFLLAIWIGSALFTVRGYVITREALLVQRLFWRSEVPLRGLTRASADPQAMAQSLRMFGNGGMFSFTGLYRNTRLGQYRAYATDPARAVVLEVSSRAVVVTPEAPGEFLGTLRSLHPGVEVSA